MTKAYQNQMRFILEGLDIELDPDIEADGYGRNTLALLPECTNKERVCGALEAIQNDH